MRYGVAVITLLLVLLAGVVGFGAFSSNDDRRHVAATRAPADDGVVRVVVIGDSVAHGAGDERGVGLAGPLERQLRALKGSAVVQNFGVDGARTSGARRVLKNKGVMSAVTQADVVVLSIGGNDLYGDRIAQAFTGVLPSLQQRRILSRVEEVVHEVVRINPAAKVYVLGLYNPYRSSARGAWLDQQVNRWDARLIMRFASDRQVTVLRICDLLQNPHRISSRDRFHPGASGYAAIASRIASSF